MRTWKSVPQDGGPVYAETHGSDRFPVEPWNTASNLIFLVLIIYFAWRTRLRLLRHPITVTALPVLAVGFVGGTLYHALRSESLWRILDAGPIAFLALLASMYLWRVILGDLLKAMVVIILPALAYRLADGWLDLPDRYVIAAGYGFLAVLIILPAILHCRKQQWRDGRLLIGAAGSFALAMLCRQLDARAPEWGLPMGTHFLWHLLGGAASFFLMAYIFRVEKIAETKSEVRSPKSETMTKPE